MNRHVRVRIGGHEFLIRVAPDTPPAPTVVSASTAAVQVSPRRSGPPT